jgi:hypothetical protein
MATNIVDIDQVEPDIDPMAVGVVRNPLFEDFTHNYAGKPQTIPAATKKIKVETVEKEVIDEKTGEKKMVKEKIEKEVLDKVGKKQFPLYVAVHMANHLAQKIIRAEYRAGIAAIADDKKRELESAKPIPDYKGKVWEMMKELVETDSDFFEEKGLGSDGMKERFIR